MPRYGQHFLINEHAIERIVDALGLTTASSVLEIGPGKGALTVHMLSRAAFVTAIEVDPVWVRHLQTHFSDRPNFNLVHQDILKFDFGTLPPLSRGVWRVAGNLPYNLTSPILRRLCSWEGWDEAVIMVQKEVGDRLVAKVATSDYGALTVGVSLTCSVSRVFDLGRTSFNPPPKVESSVLRLSRRPEPLDSNIDHVQKVIQAAFQQRRKTIINSLSHGLSMDKSYISSVLKTCDIQEIERPERLSVDNFVSLSRLIRNHS